MSKAPDISALQRQIIATSNALVHAEQEEQLARRHRTALRNKLTDQKKAFEDAVAAFKKQTTKDITGEW